MTHPFQPEGMHCSECRLRYDEHQRHLKKQQNKRYRDKHGSAPVEYGQAWIREINRGVSGKKKGQPWSLKEIAILKDPSTSITEKVGLLDRSYQSLTTQRRYLKRNGRW